MVVPESDGRAEDAHDRIADELLDPAAEPLELGPHALVIRREERTHVLGVELLGASREPHEIDEHDRDDAPLLARCPLERASGAPHALQNFAPTGLCCPQRVQVDTGGRLESQDEITVVGTSCGE